MLIATLRMEASERHAYLIDHRERLRTAIVDAKNAALHVLSKVGALTEIANRRAFDELSGRAWDVACERSEGLSLLLVDIDHFKRLNDTYGHQAGDRALHCIAQCLRRRLSPGSVLARYGGEEFAVLLADGDLARSHACADMLRDTIQHLHETEDGAGLPVEVTVSIGVAVTRPASVGSVTDLIAAADQALYRAKAMGRNRVAAAADNIAASARSAPPPRSRCAARRIPGDRRFIRRRQIDLAARADGLGAADYRHDRNPRRPRRDDGGAGVSGAATPAMAARSCERRLGLEKLKLPAAERRDRALQALARVGLREHERRWPHQLSGGQRQRVALASALCLRPELLLMDEPFSALDAPTREALQDEIVRIWRDQNITVLFVTHDVDEAVYVADRVVALGGKPGEVRSSLPIDVERPARRDDPRLRSLSEKIRIALSADAPDFEDWTI